jgi:CRP-like cAMP-binding protein
MKQGEPGECMYVLFKGKLDVIIDGVGKVGEITGRTPVGEAAIKNNLNRSATITASSAVVITLMLRKNDYTDVLMTLKRAEKIKFTKLLQAVSFFSSWSPVKLMQFSSYLMSYNFPADHVIYKLGDPSPTFYIITKGKVLLQTQVDVTQHHRWPVGERQWELLNFQHKFKVTVRTLEAGQFFGESEVINDWPRQTSAVAAERTQCLIVNRKELVEVLSSSDIEKVLNFAPLSIPTDKVLERQVLEKMTSRKNYHKALIDAADVDFSPSKRGVMTNRRSLKMKGWIENVKGRIKDEHDQMRAEIIESKKSSYKVPN